ncbi:MAG: hypothetical protein LBF19_04010, partial [Prevotellaceae bacterium]|nr:hypothetical protein [Prevotellaceae bacterium]
STVTVTLDGLPAGDRFNWCAYASDYPPNATEGAGFYELHGTPPFLINDTITEPTRHYAGCITSLTDRTGCPGLIPVSPAITAFTALPDTICAGDTVTLAAVASDATEYSFDGGISWVTGTTKKIAPGQDTSCTLKVRNAAGCTVTFAPLPVTVHPLPNATFNSPPATACAGDSVTLTASGGSSYCFTHTCTHCGRNLYKTGNGDPTEFDCLLSGESCSYTADNSYTLAMPDSGSVTVWVRVINANGCTDSISATITVYELPAAPVLSGGGTYCNSAASLNCYGEADYTYQLLNDLLAPVDSQTGTGTTLNFPITASGMYTVRITDPLTGCTAVSNAQPVTVEVTPTAPTALTSDKSAICNGETVSITLTAIGGDTGTGAVYEWGTGAVVGRELLSPPTTTVATRTVSVAAATTYWVRLISTTACADTTAGVTLAIGMAAPFTAGSITTATYVNCHNVAGATIADATSPAGGAGDYTYQWTVRYNSGTAAVVTDPAATAATYLPPATTTAGTYRYRRQVKESCTGAFTQSSGTVTRTVYPPFDAGSISGSGVSTCMVSIDAGIVASGASGSYTYRWVRTDASSGSTYYNTDSAGHSFTTAELATAGVFTYYREVHDNTCNPDVWSRSAGSYELTVLSGCPYTGSDLYQDGTHLCQLRSGGAQNWEAYIKDARDNKIYRIVQMPDCHWYFGQKLDYRGGTGHRCYQDNTSLCDTYGVIYGLSAVDAGAICPSGWAVPTGAEWTALRTALGGDVPLDLWHIPGGGNDKYGFTAVPDIVWFHAHGWGLNSDSGTGAWQTYWGQSACSNAFTVNKRDGRLTIECPTGVNGNASLLPVRCRRAL